MYDHERPYRCSRELFEELEGQVGEGDCPSRQPFLRNERPKVLAVIVVLAYTVELELL